MAIDFEVNFSVQRNIKEGRDKRSFIIGNNKGIIIICKITAVIGIDGICIYKYFNSIIF